MRLKFYWKKILVEKKKELNFPNANHNSIENLIKSQILFFQTLHHTFYFYFKRRS
jgi:hypothetical protein